MRELLLRLLFELGLGGRRAARLQHQRSRQGAQTHGQIQSTTHVVPNPVIIRATMLSSLQTVAK